MATGQRTEQQASKGAAAQETTPAASSVAPTPHKRGPRAGTEMAKHGGMAVKAKYGHDFFARIGAKGGKTARERLGAEFYSAIGKRGGQATRERLGTAHYERIGRLGGLRTRRRERQAADIAKESQ